MWDSKDYLLGEMLASGLVAATSRVSVMAYGFVLADYFDSLANKSATMLAGQICS